MLPHTLPPFFFSSFFSGGHLNLLGVFLLLNHFSPTFLPYFIIVWPHHLLLYFYPFIQVFILFFIPSVLPPCLLCVHEKACTAGYIWLTKATRESIMWSQRIYSNLLQPKYPENTALFNDNPESPLMKQSEWFFFPDHHLTPVLRNPKEVETMCVRAFSVEGERKCHERGQNGISASWTFWGPHFQPSPWSYQAPESCWFFPFSLPPSPLPCVTCFCWKQWYGGNLSQ